MVNLRWQLTQSGDWGAGIPGIYHNRGGYWQSPKAYYKEQKNEWRGYDYWNNLARAKGGVLGRRIEDQYGPGSDYWKRYYQTDTILPGYNRRIPYAKSRKFTYGQSTISRRPRSLGNASRNIRCYRCGMIGHIARYCRVYIR